MIGVLAVLAQVRSELTKIVTLRGVRLCCAVLLGLHVVIQVVQLGLYVDAVRRIDAAGMIEIFTGSRVPAVPEMTEQLVAAMFTPVPFVAVTGALIAGSEFPTGQIGVSLAATPSRVRLVVAKAIATTWFTVALCLAFALLTTALMYPAVKDWNPQILLSTPVLAGYARVTLIAAATNLLTLALALLTRRTLAAILIMAALLGATITQVVAVLSPALDAGFPVSAARNLLFYDSRDITPALTSGPGTAAVVLLAWAGASVAVSVSVTSRRDAR